LALSLANSGEEWRLRTHPHIADDLRGYLVACTAAAHRARVYTLIVYTGIVLERIGGFDWDAANVGHILRHSVTPLEVEDVAVRPHVVIPARTIKSENRWKLFGKASSGRYLVVVFTIRRKLFRAVTAYEMNTAERTMYARQID
jgi:uncharacterized DUF497 family protein